MSCYLTGDSYEDFIKQDEEIDEDHPDPEQIQCDADDIRDQEERR